MAERDARRGLPLGATSVLLVLLCAACNASGSGPAPVVWGVDVPPPSVENAIVERNDSTVTLMPSSPTGAVVGVDYAYEMPHCGIDGLVDVDGSFWDVVGDPPGENDYGFDDGTFRLISPIRATFRTPYVEEIQLERHRGSKAFHYCM